jgi:hypothetical protein
MFSGITNVKILKEVDLTVQVVEDINALLKQQHSDANTVDRFMLLEHMRWSRIACATSDDTVIGMGVLGITRCVSHEFAGIHNLIVLQGFDAVIIGKRIVDLLREDIHHVAFIQITKLPSPELAPVLVNMGFVEKSEPRFRLRFPKKCK